MNNGVELFIGALIEAQRKDIKEIATQIGKTEEFVISVQCGNKIDKECVELFAKALDVSVEKLVEIGSGLKVEKLYWVDIYRLALSFEEKRAEDPSLRYVAKKQPQEKAAPQDKKVQEKKMQAKVAGKAKQTAAKKKEGAGVAEEENKQTAGYLDKALEKMQDKQFQDLVKRFYIEKDYSAREGLILKCLKVVSSVIKNRFDITKHDQDYEDMVSEGILALEEGIDSYSANHKATFLTSLYTKVSKRLKTLYPQLYKLDSLPAKPEYEEEINESDQGEWEDEVYEKLYNEERKRFLIEAVDLLEPRKRAIVEFLWGINGNEEHSFSQTARRFDCSAEWVRQCAQSAQKQIKKYYDAKILEAQKERKKAMIEQEKNELREVVKKAKRKYAENNLDDSEREQLILRNIPLVESIIKNNFKIEEQSYEDMLSDGIYILERSIDSYSAKNEQSLGQYLRENILLELQQLYDSGAFDVKEEIYGDTDGREWEDEVVENITRKDNMNLVRKILDKIDPKKREIFECRWGLVDGKEKTYEQTAKKFGLTKEEVNKVCSEVLFVVRRKMKIYGKSEAEYIARDYKFVMAVCRIMKEKFGWDKYTAVRNRRFIGSYYGVYGSEKMSKETFGRISRMTEKQIDQLLGDYRHEAEALLEIEAESEIE